MNRLVKFQVIVAGVSFTLIFVAGVIGRIATVAGVDPALADRFAKAAMLVLFSFFGCALIGMMIHLFIVLQAGIGNGNAPMIRFLQANEARVTFGAWAFLGLGAMVALPFAFHDLGFHLPLRTQGVLDADIGMTLDEVKRRSTISMRDPHRLDDGVRLGVEQMVFEFRIGDSNVRFPNSRYYWIQTPANDSHISVMQIGISPQKMSTAELDTFQHAAQAQLFADGWMPGHFVAHSEETVRLWGGKRTTQDGRYWLKNDTVLSFERRRMDVEKPGEPPGSGEYIVDIHLESKKDARDVVFEPSAWKAGVQ